MQLILFRVLDYTWPLIPFIVIAANSVRLRSSAHRTVLQIDPLINLCTCYVMTAPSMHKEANKLGFVVGL